MGSGVSTGSLLVSDVLSLRLCIMIVVVGKRRRCGISELCFLKQKPVSYLYYLYLKNKNQCLVYLLVFIQVM